MKTLLCVVFCLLGFASMPSAHAAVVYSPDGVTIARIYSYSEFGSGDVAFTVAGGGAVGCDGFWLRPSDPGFKTLYALLLVAYSTKQPIMVGGVDDSIWTGSASRFCRVYGIYPN
jgi:hypothetical protein